MQTAHHLAAELRENTGTGGARAVRRGHRIPAIMYGPGHECCPISVDRHDIELEMKKPGFTARVLHLAVADTEYKVLPREVARHPVSGAVEHLDFYHIGAAESVQLKVRLKFINQDKSIGLKLGGVLNAVQRELMIRTSPTTIPEYIEVDIGHMQIGDSLRLNAIPMPEGVRALSKDPHGTIATITGRKVKKGEGEEDAAAATPAAK